MSSEILAFILILMIFFHIVDDYYLQGILAQMKQSSWWKENTPSHMVGLPCRQVTATAATSTIE